MKETKIEILKYYVNGPEGEIKSFNIKRELIDKYIDVKNKIIEQIEQINNEDYYTVLFLRYVRKFTFEKIANETGWCWRQVHRIHAKALQAFEDKYGSEYL